MTPQNDIIYTRNMAASLSRDIPGLYADPTTPATLRHIADLATRVKVLCNIVGDALEREVTGEPDVRPDEPDQRECGVDIEALLQEVIRRLDGVGLASPSAPFFSGLLKVVMGGLPVELLNDKSEPF